VPTETIRTGPDLGYCPVRRPLVQEPVPCLESLVLGSWPLHRLPLEAGSGQQPLLAAGPELQADFGNVAGRLETKPGKQLL